MAIAIGEINFTRNIKTDNSTPDMVPPFEISASTFLRPKNHPINSAINNPPTGNKRFAEIQSIKSKKFNPNKVNDENSPIDKEHIIPRMEIKIVASIVENLLFHLNSSIKYATTTSKIEIADVIAATDKRIKNSTEKMYPPGI